MQGSTTPGLGGDGYAARLTDVPLALLRAELERRSVSGSMLERSPAKEEDGDNADSDGDTCGSETRSGLSYNTPVHVGALFLILILSTLGEFGVYLPHSSEAKN